MSAFIDWLNGVVWSSALVYLCLGAGVYFTIRSRAVQIRQIPAIFKQMFTGKSSNEGVSSFQALAISLAGRVGVGNIAGVATAIGFGGPGAVVWMWISALLGASTSYVESTLGQIFKEQDPRTGEYRGGPAYYILHGLNPERMLIAAEALGIGRVALDRAVKYANERVVFDRPIGMNQGIQFPLADSLARLDAAELILRKATWLYDNGKPCGREANMAKYLCADAGFGAADRALQTHGGMGYSEEYNISRFFRESRLMKIAPVSQEMILNFLSANVLGLPKSY